MLGVRVIAAGYADMIDSMATDITGNFSFQVKPTSDYTLYFSKTGYITDSIKVAASGVNGVLEIPPVFLSPVKPLGALIAAPAIAEKETAVDNHLHTRLAELAQNVYFNTASAVITTASFRSLDEIITLLKDYRAGAGPRSSHTCDWYSNNASPVCRFHLSGTKKARSFPA